MTKKDYELIASALLVVSCFNDNGDDEFPQVMKDKIANKLAEALASKNPRFQKDKFLQACGVEIWQEAECGHGIPKSKQCLDCDEDIR